MKKLLNNKDLNVRKIHRNYVRYYTKYDTLFLRETICLLESTVKRIVINGANSPEETAFVERFRRWRKSGKC